jgi:hypothetical protein
LPPGTSRYFPLATFWMVQVPSERTTIFQRCALVPFDS